MSLDSVELVMRIEREFNVDIPDEDARALATVGDMASFLLRAFAQQRASGLAVPSWTSDTLLDALKDIIVDEVGIKRDLITADARFVRDLGIN